MKYWAYRHINGHAQVKVFRGDKATIEDAYDSPFVYAVLEPYESASREDAVQHARENLEKVPENQIGKEV